MLGFVSGLLTGTSSLFTGRWEAVGKSPLTGTWGEASCGGTLSPALKRCGFDGIFFKGASPHPVYLFLEDDRPELRDASHLWGLDAVETDRALKQAAGKRPAAVACIGPAGENLALIAGICNDAGRLAARSGLGAVMGAKKLKAVVLCGSQSVKACHPEQMKRLNRKLVRYVRFNFPLPRGSITRYLGTLMRLLPFQVAQDGMLYKMLLHRWGTPSMNQVSVEMGDAPIQNWRGSSADFPFKQSDALDPDRIARQETKKYHCYSCPLACGGVCLMNGKSVETHRPEYETILAWSGLLMNTDLESIFQINDLLNRAGMDSISAGGTVAFAMECFEKGLLTREDTGGLELTWGNSEAILALVKKMAAREGIGDLLADGSKRAAERLGRGAHEFAVHAGGQEPGMHDGRNDPGFALHAVVEPAPGRHTSGSQLYYEMFQLWKKVEGLPAVKRVYPKGEKYLPNQEKAAMAAACSKFTQVMNGAGLCLFGAFLGVHRLPIFEWLNAATGWEKTPAEYLLIGEHIQTLRQAFNAREGAPLRHEINPRALGIPPQARGANRGRSVDLEQLVPLYWQEFGWNAQTGAPGQDCLERLGLEEIVNPTSVEDLTPPNLPKN